MRQQHQSVTLKQEFCTKAKLFIFKSSHKCWIRKEKERSRAQAAEMGFLRRASGLTLLDKGKRAVIRSKHRILVFPTRKITTALVWTCGTNVQERTAAKLLSSTPSD